MVDNNPGLLRTSDVKLSQSSEEPCDTDTNLQSSSVIQEVTLAQLKTKVSHRAQRAMRTL